MRASTRLVRWVLAATAVAAILCALAPTTGRVDSAQAGAGADAISAGGDHTCALKDGGIWCWGLNFHGQLGNNSTMDSPLPVAVSGLASGVSAISAGNIHSCALKDGGVWCWGYNGNGQLGNEALGAALGFDRDSHVPVAVTGLTSGVSAIVAGGDHTCALKDGDVWCWGVGVNGQLGNNSTTDSPVPLAVSGLPNGVTAIGAGYYDSCALADGGVWCWGYNFHRALGDSSTTACVNAPCSPVPVAMAGLTSGVSAISAGAYHTCGLKDGGLSCWGENSHGQLGDGSATDSPVPVAVSEMVSGISAISAGQGDTCALKDGGVWCWGWNLDGQLGNNSTTDSPAPVAVLGLESGVSAISAGGRHTCALKNDGGIWCWGLGESGQLGNNTTANSPAPVTVSELASAVSAGEPPVEPTPLQPSTNSTDHRAAYALGGIAAAVLAIVAAGGWAIWRQRPSRKSA